MSDPVTCAVLLCPSAEQSRSLRSVCFFDFPHPNDPRYPVWIERTLRSEDWTPSSSSKICSKHFRSTDIIALPHADDSKRTEKRLKYDALPCVFEGIPDSMRPPADVVPRADSPEIILAGQRKQFVNQGISDSMRPPTDVVPRPDSPEIVPTTNCSKKRSADCMDDNICDETQKESSDLLNASTEVAEAPTNAHLNVSLTDPAILSNNSTGANAPGPVFSAAAVSGAKRTRLLPPPVVCAPKTIPIRPPCSLARKFVDGRLTGVQHCSQHIPVDYPAPTGADEALRCCVPGCLNRRDNNPQGRIYFHAFPTDKRFQTEWIKRVAFSSFWQPAAHSVVCSVHFLSSDYGFIGSILCLKPTAIPSRLGCRNGLMRKLNGPCPFSRVCAICGCWRAIKQDSYYKSASRMAFIPFPEEPSERQKWLTACNGVSCEGQLYACERHFVLADILARFEQDREMKFELQRRDDILPHPSFPVFIPFPLEKRAPTMSGSTQVAIGPLSSPTNSSNSSKNPLNGAVLQNPTVANTPFSLVIRSAKHSTSPEGYRILLMPKQIALPAVASPTALPPVGPSREAFVRTNPSIPMKPSQLPTCSECGMRFGADIQYCAVSTSMSTETWQYLTI
ncbi:uncharacterized protein LOC129585475 isoform X2 [Paramacrobiotus metropolitanus]|uniref:uncharacterized protein LOC129585475 isoform X2 n=1 Tax=Paramacrobiotus metropolitanus TaxID=2943436 RepID=UPI0024457D75|nr:uncharacterized protein LOC129585475 isoform X2 [Paramacrobiotus metropolitanus]